MKQGCHTHFIPGLKSGSFDTKKFTFSVEAFSQEEALQKLSEVISATRESSLQFRETPITIGGVTANYFYPYRPHCGMIGPHWDE